MADNSASPRPLGAQVKSADGLDSSYHEKPHVLSQEGLQQAPLQKVPALTPMPLSGDLASPNNRSPRRGGGADDSNAMMLGEGPSVIMGQGLINESGVADRQDLANIDLKKSTHAKPTQKKWKLEDGDEFLRKEKGDDGKKRRYYKRVTKEIVHLTTE